MKKERTTHKIFGITCVTAGVLLAAAIAFAAGIYLAVGVLMAIASITTVYTMIFVRRVVISPLDQLTNDVSEGKENVAQNGSGEISELSRYITDTNVKLRALSDDVKRLAGEVNAYKADSEEIEAALKRLASGETEAAIKRAGVSSGCFAAAEALRARIHESSSNAKQTTAKLSDTERFVKEAAAVLKEVSNGKLEVKIEGDYNGLSSDVSDAKNALNALVKDIDGFVSKVSAIFDALAKRDFTPLRKEAFSGAYAEALVKAAAALSAISDMSAGFNEKAAGIARQTDMIAVTGARMENAVSRQSSAVLELGGDMASIRGNARKNAEAVESALLTTKSMAQKCTETNESMTAMLETLSEINAASKSISGVIKTIDDISFQTRLLALNASIEAARAGVHGRSFGVVAEQVSDLAGKSKDSADETATLLEGMLNKFQESMQISQKTAGRITSFLSDAERITALLGEISEAEKEQDETVTDATSRVAEIEAAINDHTLLSYEASAAAQELLRESDNLKLGNFKKEETGKRAADSTSRTFPQKSETSEQNASAKQKPTAQTDKPAPKPVTQAPKPVTQAPKPVTQAPKPVAQAPKPAAQAPKPAAQAPKPAAQAPKPVTQAPKPAAQAPKPVTQAPKPVTQAPKPAAQAPKPAAQAPKPIAQQTAKSSGATATNTPTAKKPVAMGFSDLSKEYNRKDFGKY